MPNSRKSSYDLSETSEAMHRELQEWSLEKEIGLLRLKLQKWVENGQTDDNFMLRVITILARALTVQGQVPTVDPAEPSKRFAAAIRNLGVILEEDRSE
jgi:hypothetical protein